MEKQLEKDLRAYILQELLRSRNRGEIITEVCHRANCAWVEGEYLLESTERDNKVLLRQEKSPLRMGISILAAAAGLVWVLVLLIHMLAPLVRYWLENSHTLGGYSAAPGLGGQVFQLVLALAILVIGIILITQQLKMIKR
jgi:hypothetical protein